MKTTDLILLILLELNECDKYGLELTKSIETKTQGKISIKQPTLYTILKKLEKSKFITSYWQDSEIGGKRHYYKLTENGRMQVSTLPSFDALAASIINDNSNDNANTAVNVDKEEVESLTKETNSVMVKPEAVVAETSVSPAPTPIDEEKTTETEFLRKDEETSFSVEEDTPQSAKVEPVEYMSNTRNIGDTINVVNNIENLHNTTIYVVNNGATPPTGSEAETITNSDILTEKSNSVDFSEGEDAKDINVTITNEADEAVSQSEEYRYTDADIEEKITATDNENLVEYEEQLKIPDTVSMVDKEENTQNVALKTNIEEDEQVSFDFGFEDKSEEDITNEPEQRETISPSSEIFANQNIDSLTETEINKNNLDILKSETEKRGHVFADSKEVQKFTEKDSSKLTEEYKDKLKTIYQVNEIPEAKASIDDGMSVEKVGFVDYVNFSKTDEYLYAKRIAKGFSYRALATSGVLLFLLIFTSIIMSALSVSSAIYIVFLIISLLIIIFYPILILVNYDQIRLKYEHEKLKIDLKRQSIVCAIVVGVVILFCLVVSLSSSARLTFAAFFAPVILSLAVFADLLFTYLFFKDVDEAEISKS